MVEEIILCDRELWVVSSVIGGADVEIPKILRRCIPSTGISDNRVVNSGKILWTCTHGEGLL
jgi:hypothetical protein